MELPEQELGPIATHEIWGETLEAIAAATETHAITLVFVNTRRLVERVAHQLSARLGEEAVVAHHGSLSRATRWDAEQKLKNGQVKVCVATASLELGIDIGEIDLVCQIGSPRSIGLLVQRVGRSGHTVGGVPKGMLFPLTRDEMLECAALSRALRKGNLDTFTIPAWPLDVLSQQMVAACAAEEWSEDALFELFRRAYPYRDLPREKFDQVVESLSQGFAPRQGRNGAHLHRDGINQRLKGRRGARLAAMTSGGANPGQRGLRRGGRPGGHLRRDGERGLRHREHGRGHFPAGQHAVEDPAGGKRTGAGGGRPGQPTHHPLLAGGGTGSDLGAFRRDNPAAGGRGPVAGQSAGRRRRGSWPRQGCRGRWPASWWPTS